MKRIFLDDIRFVPQGYNLVFRNGEDLIKYLKEHPNEHYDLISFDHDLGQNVMDGFDVIKEIVNNENINFTFDKFQFHTDNLTGFVNMFYYLISARKNNVISMKGLIDPFKHTYIDGVEENLNYSPIPFNKRKEIEDLIKGG
jgi:hypothetical protein